MASQLVSLRDFRPRIVAAAAPSAPSHRPHGSHPTGRVPGRQPRRPPSPHRGPGPAGEGEQRELRLHHHQHPRAAAEPRWSVEMRECSRRGDVDGVLRALRARAAAGLGPGPHTHSAVIAALGNAGRCADALAAFDAAWARPGCRNGVVANAAIAACARQGDWAGAEHVSGAMAAARVPRDTISYNSLIKTAGAAGLLPAVVALFRELRAAPLRPSPVTYATVFTAAARNRCADAGWLLEVWDDMGGADVGLAPNDWVLSAFFSAASYAACTPAHLDRVFGALARYRAAGGRPNDTAYAALLTLVTRRDIPERAVDVWTAVRQDGAALSPHLFSALFMACKRGTSPALADVAVEAFEELRTWWVGHRGRDATGRVERDVRVAFNCMLSFIGDLGQVDEALALHRDMLCNGPSPDFFTYNTLIAACSHSGDVSTALGLFGEMIDSGVAPTEHTVGALINAFAKGRDVPKARLLFDSMPSLGLSPNVEIYTSLMDASVREGSPESVELAFGLLDRMRREGLAPTAVTVGCLMAACERSQDVDRAFLLYQQACAEGVAPSDEMHDVLIKLCTAASRLDEAVDLVKASARAHTSLQQATLNSLVRALAPQAPDRALRMLSLMQAMGMRPTRRTLCALVEAAARSSRGDAAYSLYRSLRAQGMEVDASAGSALIVCLCKANQLELAVSVCDEMMACAWRAELQPGGLPPDVARKGALRNRAQGPGAEALAALAQAFASANSLRPAWYYYKQLRRRPRGMAAATMSSRRLWEALIENYCRADDVTRALQVFDDWKAASGRWLAYEAPRGGAGAGDPARYARYPKLSAVTLAFLEACCRAQAQHEWRVYDVCAVLRQQAEMRQAAALARPQKRSHHFADVPPPQQAP